MRLDRRQASLGLAASVLLPAARAEPVFSKPIPATGERIPAIGMGSWLTFDVGSDRTAIAQRGRVLATFFAAGGTLVDSSPMYGSSQATIGAALQALKPSRLFAADKVWIRGAAEGRAQIAESARRWRRSFDLLQIHNLVDWRTQMATLRAMKEAGQVRYIGVTSYDGIAYDEVASIMRAEPIDFVQVSYNIADRSAERRVLPLAAERGIAVIANRPFQEGRLIDAALRRPLPAIAVEAGARNWPEYLLKFIVSHPAVTAAIPATRRVDHMRENMAALRGTMPTAATRARMAAAFDG